MTPLSLFPAFRHWREIKLSDYHTFIRENPGQWVSKLESQAHAKFYGGWLEDRSIFFDSRHDPQAIIHVGVDFWLPANTPVVCPLAGVVRFSRPASDTHGGWGGRIDIEASGLVYIFGHLKKPTLQPGDQITQRQVIGELAERADNGGWFPHLHLQAMSVEAYTSYKNPNDIDAYAPPEKAQAMTYPNPLA